MTPLERLIGGLQVIQKVDPDAGVYLHEEEIILVDSTNQFIQQEMWPFGWIQHDPIGDWMLRL